MPEPMEGRADWVVRSRRLGRSIEPSATTAVSLEGPGAQSATPPPNAMEVSLAGASDRAGVPPPQPPQPSPWPYHRAGVADPPQVPAADRNAVPIGYVRVRPTRVPNLHNFPAARRLLMHTLGVQMSWSMRQGWERAHITYVGPEHLLDEAVVLGEDMLTYPERYEDPAEN